MDYVTRQFINLTKKFRKELRLTLTELTEGIHKQTEAIRKAAESSNPQQTPPEIASLMDSIETIKREQNAAKSDADKWQKRNFWVQFGGVFILLAYTVFTGFMYFANKKAADAAKSAADVAVQGQRPVMWLSNNNGTPEIFKNPRNPEEGQILWTWHFTNYGKTPPSNVRYRKYFKIGNTEPAISYGEEGDSIGPPTPPSKDEFDTVVSSPMPITAMTDLINQGQIRIIVTMTYSDVTHAQYESGFCLWRTNAGSVAYCKDGNYIK